MKTVAVVGASGFVGSTLIEWLLKQEQYTVRPLIHSSGNAWRLARLGIELFPTDVLSEAELRQVLRGCDFVVNCSRGSSEVMINGLKNLLRVSRQYRVERFIHLGSTAVFGETFTQTVVDETHPVNAVSGSYGDKKARQDELVKSAARRGLPAVVLCPPNITGPYSAYLLEIVQSLESGKFALVDEGRMNCTVVDVRNLVHAIETALTAPVSDGRRIIIADSEPNSWESLVGSYLDITGASKIGSVSIEEAQKLSAAPQKPRKSLLRALRYLASSDVRSALRKDPLWDGLHGVAIRAAKSFPKEMQNWLRSNGQASGSIGEKSVQTTVDVRLIAQQMRNVRFSCQQAYDVMGYMPIVNDRESGEAFSRWYRSHFGMETEFSDLLGIVNRN